VISSQNYSGRNHLIASHLHCSNFHFSLLPDYQCLCYKMWPDALLVTATDFCALWIQTWHAVACTWVQPSSYYCFNGRIYMWCPDYKSGWPIILTTETHANKPRAQHNQYSSLHCIIPHYFTVNRVLKEGCFIPGQSNDNGTSLTELCQVFKYTNKDFSSTIVTQVCAYLALSC